jgi:predicted nuclease of predicted toxin-antitoxin system
VKFLVDRCAGARLADWLRREGHDVIESRELGPDPGDRALLEISVREKRILITIDTDFGSLIFMDGMDHAGIVRLPDVPVEKRIYLFSVLFARHASDLESGAIITCQGNRIRISRSPRKENS